jgi:hypothetical protein
MGEKEGGGRFSLSFLICSLSLIQITIKKHWRSRVGPWGRRRGGGYYLLWVYILYGIPFVLFIMGIFRGGAPPPTPAPHPRGSWFQPRPRPPSTWQNSRPQARYMAELQAPGRPVHGRTPGPRGPTTTNLETDKGGCTTCIARPHAPKPKLHALTHRHLLPLLPQRVCCAWLSAMPVQHARVPEQAQENTPPGKN